ncbi:hypothetical protein ABIE20_004607 [Pseudomonas sp. 2835]
MRWRRALLGRLLRRWPACRQPWHAQARCTALGFFLVLHGIQGWVVEAASLSIQCGAAAGPFRLYGGLLFSWEEVGKTACSCIRPYAALRVPSLRHLPGHRGLRLASQVYISRLRLPPKVLRTAPTGTYARPPEVAFRGAWKYVHEHQDQDQTSWCSFYQRACPAPVSAMSPVHTQEQKGPAVRAEGANSGATPNG